MGAESNSHSVASLSTAHGSEHTKVLLPREHNMTKEQLMAKVRKEAQSVMEFLANSHDRLGNGFAAYLYVMKKMT